jgi:hypothetical protein
MRQRSAVSARGSRIEADDIFRRLRLSATAQAVRLLSGTAASAATGLASAWPILRCFSATSVQRAHPPCGTAPASVIAHINALALLFDTNGSLSGIFHRSADVLRLLEAQFESVRLLPAKTDPKTCQLSDFSHGLNPRSQTFCSLVELLLVQGHPDL